MSEPGAASRALELLEAVARIGPGATARELSRTTGIPSATAYRLLNVLVADGYLVRIGDLSGFALGRRTRELAGAAEGPPQLAEVVAGIRGRVRFGLFVADWPAGTLRLVDRDPDHELPGERTLLAHPHASAMGKIMLAAQPELVPDRPRALTRHTVTAGAALAAELRTVARTGVATEVDELRSGRSSVAVAVRDAAGGVVACLAALGPTGRLPVTDPDLTALLRAGADRIGGLTGARAPGQRGRRT
ncbi:IclR family transcriptional regulator [Pseudonocardia sp. HH130629-09]|uniref:IclR family transcriptional regulator n=1 Tax=Pseudonocardia sp. HH130629-09 TaxID=1641402 RepID=UPI0006CB34CF|nr:helix-turn-helix domain-containing protein [Pseudonocardia sp. HH130629-09]ALE84610.1 IclR family transcriptional regulator [Pseudonocardia sp. HH130629-09]